MFPALFLYRPTMYLFPRVTDGWNPHPHCLHWPSKLISELRFLEEIFFSWNVPFESFVKNRQERILENSAKTVFSSEKKYGSIDTSSKKFYHRDGKIFYSIFTVHSIHFNSNFDTYVELNYSWNNSHINRIIRMLHSNEDDNDIKRNVSLEDATFHYSWNNNRISFKRFYYFQGTVGWCIRGIFRIQSSIEYTRGLIILGTRIGITIRRLIT